MIQLSRDSWLEIRRDAVIATDEELVEMFSSKEKPSTRDTIKMYGKVLPVPRFQKLYGDSSYTFSGIAMKPQKEIPKLVERCIQYARDSFPQHHWNGALANWYMDGNDSISPHSDDEKDMDKSAPILSFNFGGVRTFEVRAKKSFPDSVNVQEVKLFALPSSVIIMGGNMQEEFVHGVPKVAGKKLETPIEPRLNVTVRSFVSRDVVSSSKRSRRD